MSLAKAYSAQLIGLSIEIITIEVDISNGLHSLSIVGLGDRAIDEAKDRISAAIKNSGFRSPKQRNQKVIISLAPADIRKEGPSFDLGMTITYLMASGELKFEPEQKLFLGELSLEGKLRKTVGILPILCQASKFGFKQAFIPKENSLEASLAKGIDIYPTSSLNEVIEHIKGIKNIEKLEEKAPNHNKITSFEYDFKMVRGNEIAKRGLEISASGAHNAIMSGPPGTGKTLLAKCFSSILPDLSYEESIEVTSIHSAAHNLDQSLIERPPFRSPHHTASYPSIVGGGSFPKPGEITLAHRGVLFLDEFPEFDSSVLESLRQPLEDRIITISRAKGVITFPAQCILIASMNPCPCGKEECICSFKSIEKYKRKISGPIIDRIDIWLNINKIDYKKLGEKYSSNEKSSTIRDRIIKTRKIQLDRFSFHGINKRFNSEMSASDIEKIVKIDESARQILITSGEKFKISGRAFHRIIKVSQTIADMEESGTIKAEHILEAIRYREKDSIK